MSGGEGLGRDEWTVKLEWIGDALASAGSQAHLVTMGSVAGILDGQPGRTTMDLDVWRPSSNYSANTLRLAVEAAGLLYDPKDVVEPDTPYLQIVQPGIVQVGEFTPQLVEQYGGLTVSKPPAENLVASKLCRANERDLYDIAWMMGRFSPDPEQIKRIIETFPRLQRQTASENLVYLEAMNASDTQETRPV